MTTHGQLLPTGSSPWWHDDFATASRRLNEEVTALPNAVGTTNDPGFGAFQRCAIVLGAHRSVHLGTEPDVAVTLGALDTLARRCDGSVESWRRVLWTEEGLTGNGIDYHDVRNSFIADVLDRRVGIPISIAVVAIAVGRRAGLPVHGVGMPGHFLLGVQETPVETGVPLLFDPFHGGITMTTDDAADRFASMFGPEQRFDPNMLRPTPYDAILIRMLANLKQNYASQRDVRGLLDVMRMRTLLPDWSLTEGRELVRLLDAFDHESDALAVCDQLEVQFPSERAMIDAERDRIVASFN